MITILRLAREGILISARSLLGVVFLLQLGQSAGAQDATNVFPGLEGDLQKIRFHTGRVEHNQPELSPVLPDIPGSPSHWSLMQWSQSQVISPTSLRKNDPSTRDDRLGLAKYAFDAPDGHSHLWVYQDPTSKHPVYELYERGGALTAAGGANVFLASDAAPGGISLGHELSYELDARLTRAEVKANLAAQRGGAVLAQVFSGFVIQFPEMDGKTLSTLFLQLPIARSIPPLGEYRSCTSDSGRRNIIIGALPKVGSSLPFEVDRGSLRHLRYDLNSYICGLVTRPIECTDSTGHKTSWAIPTDYTGFHDWKILKMYVGLETEIQDLRPKSQIKDPQGRTEVALQLANLRVTPDHGRDFTSASCAVPTPANTSPQ